MQMLCTGGLAASWVAYDCLRAPAPHIAVDASIGTRYAPRSRQRRQRTAWGPRSSFLGRRCAPIPAAPQPACDSDPHTEQAAAVHTPLPSRTAVHPALGMERQGPSSPAEGSAAGPSAAKGQGGLVSSNVYFRVACTVAPVCRPEWPVCTPGVARKLGRPSGPAVATAASERPPPPGPPRRCTPLLVRPAVYLAP